MPGCPTSRMGHKFTREFRRKDLCWTLRLAVKLAIADYGLELEIEPVTSDLQSQRFFRAIIKNLTISAKYADGSSSVTKCYDWKWLPHLLWLSKSGLAQVSAWTIPFSPRTPTCRFPHLTFWLCCGRIALWLWGLRSSVVSVGRTPHGERSVNLWIRL